MTVSLPQILMLFDTSVILNGGARAWGGYQRLGACWLPQAVLNQLRFLCNRSPEPGLEQIAREFFRFYPGSGWRTTDETMPHPTLQPSKGQALSKRARLVMTIVESAYGCSQRFPEQLVVLVSDNQLLLKQIQAMQIRNLCGLTGSALKQWSLSGKRPEAVNQAYQQMKATGVGPSNVQSNVQSPASSAKPATQTSPASKQSPIARPKTRKTKSPPSRRATPDIHTSSRFYALSQMVSLAISLVGFVMVGLLIWRLVQPQSFEQFWRQNNLPQLFGQ